jgi:NAD(P)-dependent dehydrogenase (short-subunit alcohol dehydrogenase family)
MNELKGKAAIVTGGTRGIGRAIAAALLAEGIDVAICGRDERAAAHEAEALGHGREARAIGLACDVTDYGSVSSFVERVASEFGRLDVLVNNAGIGGFAPIASMKPEDFRLVIETNLLGVFHCCHAALPHLKRSGDGYIVNISSLAGKNAFPGGTAYNASKFGLNGFSEALMQDVRYDNIRVSYVCPGSVATEFNDREAAEGAEWKLSADDVAQVVVDLLHIRNRALASCVELRPSRPKK